MVWLSWQLVVPTGQLQLFRLRANLFRTQSGQGHSAQWAKPKVVLIALTNTTLDKSHYIFTDSWVVAMAWLFGLSLGKPQTGRFKATPFGTETNWNQADGWVCTARLPMLLTWTIIRPDRVTHQPSCWVQGKRASVFDTQATTACQTFESWQKLTQLSGSEGNHIAGGIAHTCSWHTDYIWPFTSSWGHRWCLTTY